MVPVGWLKLWRSSQYHSVFEDMATWYVWCWILMNVNFKDQTTRFGEVPAGSLLTTRGEAANRLKIHESKLRRHLNRLENDHLIDQKTTRNGTLVSVCNWATYQSDDCDDRPENRPENRPAIRPENRPVLEEDKKKEIHTRPAARFSRPSVDDVRAEIERRGYDIDAEAFVAFYESNGWRVGKTPMKSWRAALTTWQKRRNDEDKHGSRFRQPVQRILTAAEIREAEKDIFVFPATHE